MDGMQHNKRNCINRSEHLQDWEQLFQVIKYYNHSIDFSWYVSPRVYVYQILTSLEKSNQRIFCLSTPYTIFQKTYISVITKNGVSGKKSFDIFNYTSPCNYESIMYCESIKSFKGLLWTSILCLWKIYKHDISPLFYIWE